MSSEHQLGIGREHRYNHLIQFGSLIMFLIVWSLDSFVFNFFEEFTRLAVLPMRLGLFLLTLLVALYLLKTSHDAVINAKESKSLVTSGPYAYVRHPMYLGPLLIYLSLIFLTMSLISFIPLIVILFLYNILVTDEEKDLERILGQEYLNYKKRVARWIPKIY
jgi:protein-S-isoprenylcysteine O-methyltransferase Ste14